MAVVGNGAKMLVDGKQIIELRRTYGRTVMAGYYWSGPIMLADKFKKGEVKVYDKARTSLYGH